MLCPFCTKDEDKVVDSRSSEGGRVIRRRRECLSCGRRYTTYERPEETLRITVVKKDGSRVPYERDKLLVALQKACYKLPVSDDQLRKMVEAIEDAILRQHEREVPTNFIGEMACGLLREANKIAYIRYASMYREFRDIGELAQAASQVLEDPQVGPNQGELFDPKET
ncbi:MAG: transcriptional regulator NrdR [Planctomycetota bacterium]|jgi:transcriptional repressor NrdR